MSSTLEGGDFYDNKYFENCNYFNDKEFAKQVALHQLLYRKLLKFKLEKDIDDGFDDNDYVIYKNHGDVSIFTNCAGSFQCNAVVFKSLKVARLAVKEVVNPFMEEHPDFIWNM